MQIKKTTIPIITKPLTVKHLRGRTIIAAYSLIITLGITIMIWGIYTYNHLHEDTGFFFYFRWLWRRGTKVSFACLDKRMHSLIRIFIIKIALYPVFFNKLFFYAPNMRLHSVPKKLTNIVNILKWVHWREHSNQ